MKTIAAFSQLSRAIIVMAALAIVITFLQAAASFITPILLAVFIAVVATPPLRWLQRHGLPKWIALAIVAFVLLDIGSILALITTGALEGFRDGLPGYQQRLVLLNEQLGSWLEGVGIVGSREALPDILDPGLATALVRILLANISGTVASGFLILLLVIFFLLEAGSMPGKLKAAFDWSDEAEARLGRLLGALNRYMVLKTLTSVMTAICVGIWLWILGIDFAVLWAMSAFVLNFVPFVGSVLMMVPAVVLTLLQTDLATTLLVALGYVIINTVIGSILEPRLMGRGLGISALAVFLSLLFWGWVFGTVGVFLSVPLTMALMIALDASPYTRPIAVLLGPAVTSQPQPTAEEAVDGSASRAVD